ncbi:MAG TPA: hypothetical protein VFA71_03935 [Terriglobales bacterium]|nr:hypothetical protein [Terriglobales bacterium]
MKIAFHPTLQLTQWLKGAGYEYLCGPNESIQLDDSELLHEQQHVARHTQHHRGGMSVQAHQALVEDLAKYHLICRHYKQRQDHHGPKVENGTTGIPPARVEAKGEMDIEELCAVQEWRQRVLRVLSILIAICALIVVLIVFLIATSIHAHAQTVGPAQDTVWNFKLTAAGPTAWYDNRTYGCTTIHLTYSNSGFSAIQLQLEYAPNNAGAPGGAVVWPDLASGTSFPLTNTTAGQATGYRYKPWIRANLTSATGSGEVDGQIVCRKPASQGDSNYTPSDLLGSVNISQIGGVAQSGDNVVDTVNHAFKVNVVAGGGTGGGPSDAAANAAASESDTARQKVTSAIRLLDTTQGAGSQLVSAKGDQTNGMWVNCKNGCSAAGDNTTGSTALAALNATITVALTGERGATFQLQSGGTGVYTVTPKCSYDGGTIYNTNGYIQDPVSGQVSLTATVASAQGTTDYPVMCPQGSSNAEMIVTSFTSGTANWLARSTVITWPNIAWGIVTTNAPSYTTGQINGLSLDTAGLLRMSLKDTPTNTNNLNVAVNAALPTGANTIGAVTQASGPWSVSCTAANCAINEAQINAHAVVEAGVNGVQAIGGNVASLATDSGNPLKTGGVFNTTQPTATNGQRVDTQVTARGAQIVATGVDNFTIANTGFNVNNSPTVNQGGAPWSVVGTLSSNGAAAAANRIGTLDGIAQTDYNNGTAATQGRDVAPNIGTDGLLWTASLPAMRPASYHASAIVTPAATATDIASMPGNATNTVLVTGIRVSCTQTTAGIVNLSILMRTSADTAGTAVTTTIHKDDQNFGAASSAPKTWTANPTKGTLEAMIDAAKVGCMATGTATPNDVYISPAWWKQKPQVLRGTAQEIEVNLGAPIDGAGTTVTGGSFIITFEWIETKTISP